MSALRSFASPAACTMYEAVQASDVEHQLDNLARLLWKGYGEGAIDDDDANFLQTCIDRRRAPGRGSPIGHLKSGAVGRMARRLGSRFLPRQRPRSPDRQASRDRRRRLGGSSALPNTLRHFYTEGQRAVLCIIAGEVKHHGVCDLPIDKIAALAGVCRTTVQTTLHEARRLRPHHDHRAARARSEEFAERGRDFVCGMADVAQAWADGSLPDWVQTGEFFEHHEEHIFKKGKRHPMEDGIGAVTGHLTCTLRGVPMPSDLYCNSKHWRHLRAARLRLRTFLRDCWLVME